MAKVPRAVIAAFFYIENQSTAVGINKSRAMAREELLMNTIEPAVTENHHDVFWLEQRNDSLYDRVRVFCVEPGVPGPRDCGRNGVRGRY